MKVLLIGGGNTVINALIHKFSKEGLKIYVLTGGHQYNNKYKHVYEQYHFSYENNCIKEVFESVRPDITIFTGAFDCNYNWENGFREITAYCAGLYNLLTAFSLLQHGRFVYLSSDEVSRITEEEYLAITKQMQLPEEEVPHHYAYACKANALKSGEDICCNYKETTGLDIITLRFENLCFLPKNTTEAADVCSLLCIEALNHHTLTLQQEFYAPFYIADAAEFLYRLIKKDNLRHDFYYIKTNTVLTTDEISHCIDTVLGITTKKQTDTKPETLWIDSRIPHNLADEIDCPIFYDAKTVSICLHSISKNRGKILLNHPLHQKTNAISKHGFPTFLPHWCHL